MSKSGYSSDLLNQLKPGDVIVLYRPLDMIEISNGCFGPKRQVLPNQGFIAVTEQRLVVKASKIDSETRGNNTTMTAVAQTINVPISKVSSITVEKKSTPGGCGSSGTTSFVLVINVQGGIYHIYTGSNSDVADEFVRSYLDIEDRSE